MGVTNGTTVLLQFRDGIWQGELRGCATDLSDVQADEMPDALGQFDGDCLEDEHGLTAEDSDPARLVNRLTEQFERLLVRQPHGRGYDDFAGTWDGRANVWGSTCARCDTLFHWQGKSLFNIPACPHCSFRPSSRRRRHAERDCRKARRWHWACKLFAQANLGEFRDTSIDRMWVALVQSFRTDNGGRSLRIVHIGGRQEELSFGVDGELLSVSGRRGWAENPYATPLERTPVR